MSFLLRTVSGRFIFKDKPSAMRIELKTPINLILFANIVGLS